VRSYSSQGFVAGFNGCIVVRIVRLTAFSDGVRLRNDYLVRPRAGSLLARFNFQ
jgi:hypothetical protein